MRKMVAILMACVYMLCLLAGCGTRVYEEALTCTGEIGTCVVDDMPIYFAVDSDESRTIFVWTKDTKVIWEDNGIAVGAPDYGYITTGLFVDVTYNKKPVKPPKGYLGAGDETDMYNALTVTVTGMAEEYALAEKPVIYLYPAQETEVTVTLDFQGELTATYPAYNNGWTVLAEPDGTLTNLADGKEYSYLFWEGVADAQYDLSSGFVVDGENTAQFLQETLSAMGLTPKEYNEFIVYWLPQMQGNPYNLISFQTEAYTDCAVLNITPEPDSVLRVFMAWRGLEEPVDVTPQELSGFERAGFTVVEWGGAEVY
jgi:hypothetical protein